MSVLVRYYYRFRYQFLQGVIQSWILRRKGLRVGRDCRFWGLPIISLAEKGQIQIGERCVLCSRSERTALGVNHAIVLRALKSGAQIIIGDDVQMSGTTVCSAQIIQIGNRVFFGANVTVSDTDFHSLHPSVRNSPLDGENAKTDSVQIGDDVFVGMNAVILKGVKIGTGAVIGAGAVVTKNVGEYTIVAGNPAKEVGRVR